MCWIDKIAIFFDTSTKFDDDVYNTIDTFDAEKRLKVLNELHKINVQEAIKNKNK